MTKTIKFTFDTDLPHIALQNVVDHIEDVLMSYGIRNYIYESKTKGAKPTCNYPGCIRSEDLKTCGPLGELCPRHFVEP